MIRTSLVALTLCIPITALAADAVVARIGDLTIDAALFDAQWGALQESQRAAFGGKAGFLREMINQKLLVAEAMKRQVHEEEVTSIALANAHDSILARLLVEREVRDKIVTEEATRQYYEQHAFTIPEMAHARHIVVTPFKERQLHNTTQDDATDDVTARAKIDRLEAELDAGADFATLAKEWSEDLTASEGGTIQPFPRGRMSKPIDDVAFTIEIGKVSQVIRTPTGFHLLLVEKRVAERKQTYEEVLSRLQQAVAQERRDSFQPRYEQLLETLRAAHEIEILDPELRPPATRPAGE